MKRLSIGLFALLLCIAHRPAPACGPWFQPTYLTDGDEKRILDMPEGAFSALVAHQLPAPTPTPEPWQPGQPELSVPWQKTTRGDLADLRQALAAGLGSIPPAVNLTAIATTGTTPTQNAAAPTTTTTGVEAVLRQYEAMRQKMKQQAEGDRPDYPSYADELTSHPVKKPVFDLAPYEPLLTQLPKEFALYTRGAALFRANELTSAVQAWAGVLALPAEQRHYRSTWAAYMTGKALLMTDPAQACEFFEQTRQLAAQGFADSLDLATASLGWQAFAEKRQGKNREALHHYFEAAPRTGDTESMAIICAEILHQPQIDPAIMQDPLVRKLIALYAASKQIDRDDTEYVDQATKQLAYHGKLLAAIKAAGVQVTPEEADLLAWTAYGSGQFTEADDWLNRAGDKHSPVGLWVRAKLLLRAGKVDEALAVYRTLPGLFNDPDENWGRASAEDFADNPHDEVRAELGVLELGRQAYLDAFDLFVHSGVWNDIAYLGERVLSRQELADYLEKHKDDASLQGSTTPARDGDGELWHEPSVLNQLRYLLARRLARVERFDEARPLMPAKFQPLLAQYVADFKAGHDKNKPARARAEALYQAAKIARENGLELLGAENEPDWASNEGEFDRSPGATTHRFEDKAASLPQDAQTPALGQALRGSEDEKKRVSEHKVDPETRFHYRYTASDLMWECARLMPDNDPLTAAALYYGGNWHRSRDEKYAEKFYQALVRRCARLPIGQQADKVRWFPADAPPEPALQIVKPLPPVKVN